MKRYVVVSSNNNPDYLFFAPYIEKAWNTLGWDVCFMITDDVNPLDLHKQNESSIIVRLPNIEGLRKETIAQTGRLYAATYLHPDSLIMTSDMDLLPLSNYWNPDINNITVYGHDLTWRTFYPMGYCAMSAQNWIKYLNLTFNPKSDIERDCKEIAIAYSSDWEQWWNHDWTLLTKRLKVFEDKLTFIDRGQIDIAGATLAKGRVDRYNWQVTLNQPNLIDAHCENHNVMHPTKLEPFLKLFESIYGKL
jgi:hypothetical protein